MMLKSEKAWIFVSHASEDLDNVRRVRNYLEERDAAPLLFHLLALNDPKDFWPLIKREIDARNFFLYCSSPSAENSEWVARELEVVKQKPVKRFHEISVSEDNLNLKSLDSFIAMTRVFPTFARADRDHVKPFLNMLEMAGFNVFNPERDLKMGERWQDRLVSEFDAAAKDGWIVAFLSAEALTNPFIEEEMYRAQHLGARFVPVMLEPMSLPKELSEKQALHGYSRSSAPEELVQLLLERDFGK